MKHKNSNTIIIGVVLAVIVLAVLVVIDRSTGYAILTDNAAFVSQNVPSSVIAGVPVTVSVTMKNTGTTTWTAANNYKLGAQNPQDNTNWVIQRALLTSTDTIKPGQTKTFTFTITPPATIGTYNFQWQMVKEKVAWFGSKTTNVQIKVNAKPACGNGLCETGESCEWNKTMNRQMFCNTPNGERPVSGDKICSACTIYTNTQYVNHTIMLEIEDEPNTDLSDAQPALTSVNTIRIDVDAENKIILNPGSGGLISSTPGILYTDTVWIYPTDQNTATVYYNNIDNDVALAGRVQYSPYGGAVVGHIDTNSYDDPIIFYMAKNEYSANLTIAAIANRPDDIISSWTMNRQASTESSRVILGKFADSEEANELYMNVTWGVAPIGNKWTMYTANSYVIQNPDGNGANDKIVVFLP